MTHCLKTFSLVLLRFPSSLWKAESFLFWSWIRAGAKCFLNRGKRWRVYYITCFIWPSSAEVCISCKERIWMWILSYLYSRVCLAYTFCAIKHWICEEFINVICFLNHIKRSGALLWFTAPAVIKLVQDEDDNLICYRVFVSTKQNL